MKRSSLFSALALASLVGAPAAFADKLEDASLQAKFEKCDTNADGKISREEHTAAAKEQYEKMDADHNGYVTLNELSVTMEAKGAVKSGKMMSPAEKMKKFDSNGDQRLSADEWTSGKAQMFDKWDSDKNGSLTTSEFMTGMRESH
jgi:Ca2+-binding EF-hand superfamily protein